MSNDIPTPTLFQGDIVRLRSSPGTVAMVVRCWADDHDHPPPPAGEPVNPLDRPLKRGEVGISLLFKPDKATPSLQIVQESVTELCDRRLQPGDIVKRNHQSAASGVVMSVDVACRVEHVLSGQQLEEWPHSEELVGALKVEAGDRVVAQDWVGVIEELFEEGIVETPSGEIWKVADAGALLDVGRRADELFPEGTGPLPALPSASLFSSSNAPPRDPSKERIVEVNATVLCINWIALSQMVPLDQQDDRPRPKRFWFGPDLNDLRHVTSPIDHLPQVGSKVQFRSSDLEQKYGLNPTKHDQGRLSVGCMLVKETRTEVDVMWQDGSVKTERTCDLIPHINIDEYDCWPGDHVLFKGDERQPEAIVQRVNAEERTAEIQIVTDKDAPESRQTTLVSVLELDPHGSPPDTFGVARGDLVLIGHSSNGCVPPRVPRIGEFDASVTPQDVRETMSSIGWGLSYTDSTSVLRSAITSASSFLKSSLGISTASPAAAEGSVTAAVEKLKGAFGSEGGIYQLSRELDDIDWYGEVTDLRLDGRVDVTLPSGKIVTVLHERLSILNEGGERDYDDGPLDDEEMEGDDPMGEEDGEWEEMSGVEDGEEYYEDEYEEVQEQVLREVDEWGREDEDSADEEHVEGSLLVEDQDLPSAPAPSEQLNGNVPPSTPTFTPVPPVEQSEVDPSAVRRPTATPPIPDNLLLPPQASSSSSSATKSQLTPDTDEWSRFLVLEDAPEDHHFYNTPVGKQNAAFSTRMQKEFKVLDSSLPETILVRTYEDRMDLIRVLIIGPAGTPYVDAPFLIDFHCDPSKYPFSPPSAFFHSWTRGMGRCNPNLYEEGGKVCLSILGTWQGEASESWNPLKSSLLQAFVSIQGLVLVREPWFCEPAFEKLRGTSEALVNSRQYSEKAYVLTRHFIVHALSNPIPSFEGEVKHFYFTLGRLGEVLESTRKLIEVSSAPAEEVKEEEERGWEQGDGVGRLTMGGMLPLKRTVDALERLWVEYQEREKTVGKEEGKME